MNILIKNGTVVTDSGLFREDLLVEGSRIKTRKEKFSDNELPDSLRIIDASGKYVFPGFIDAHTHFQLVSRGTVTADKFYDGSVLAAFGGVTTVIDFSDHIQGKRIPDGARLRNEEASGEMAVDWALHQVVTKVDDTLEDELRELKALGVRAVKIFTTYKNAGYFIERPEVEKLFRACKDLNLMVTIHAEDDGIIEKKENELTKDGYPPELLPVVRPSEAEYKAIMEYGRLAGSLDMPVYIVHLSSSRGLDAVRELKSEGVRIYAETTCHYLNLTNELLSSDMPQKYVMTPPLRKKEDNEALWGGIASGDIQIIATDHCTFTLEQKLKSNDCRTIYPGMPGTEELLQITYTKGVRKGRIPLSRMVALLSSAPAHFFGLYPEKGSLEAGTDADIVIFDPDAEGVISDGNRHTKAGYTPYNGTNVYGKVDITILRGEIIVEDGVFKGKKGYGRFVQPV